MTHASRVEYRAELVQKVPRWYSPAAHLALPAAAATTIAVLALLQVQDLRLWQVALIPAFLVAGNAIEWYAHRGLLHRRTRWLEAFYLRHTPQHHALFVADEMDLRSVKEFRFVLLPGYAILVVLAATSPVVALFVLIDQPNLAALWVATAVLYMLAYDWAHLACHLPEASRIGALPLVRRLRRHHQLHHVPHLAPRWNFNVTVPLWDRLEGTDYVASDSSSATPTPAGAVALRRPLG